MTEINIDELPRYSQWPHRLLGLTEWSVKPKSSTEVLREFDREKWGGLLETVKSSKDRLSFKQVEEAVYNQQPDIICVKGNKLVLQPAYRGFEEQYKIISDTLAEYLPATALCELGAGYGQVILRLAQEKRFANMQVVAAEYTSSGVQLIDYLAQAENLNVVTGHCDLNKPGITDVVIPEGGIIFTSYAASYITNGTLKFVDDITSFKPAMVVHFEPLYEHYDTTSLLGCMQRKYIEQNDYNRNLLSVLKEAESKGLIRIVKELPNIFGTNPFLPMSVVAWHPVVRNN
jgi:hypothetical protein